MGASALSGNSTNGKNTAVGYQALQNNNAISNTAVGNQALATKTSSGDYCTAVGDRALYLTTSGGSNTAVGGLAAYSNTTGTSNTALGEESLFNNITGSNNTAVGYQAGLNTTSSNNTFVGYGAGYLVNTGAKNTIIGAYGGNQGGLDIRSASNNIVLSDGDGNPRYTYNSSYGSSLFGTIGKLPSDTTSATTFVVGLPSAWPGTVETTCGSYTTNYDHYNFRNGNGIVGSIRTNGSGTSFLTSSDYRLKENIAPMTGALDKVSQLKPVTYKWKADGSDSQGFIAHELQAVVPECVSGEKDATREEKYEITPAVKDEQGNITTPAVMGTRTVPAYQGIDTSFLVATLTAAIQELKTIVDAQAAEIAELKAKVI